MGLLDQLFSMQNVSPWGALYRVPPTVQGQNENLTDIQNAGAAGGYEIPPQALASIPAFPQPASSAPVAPPSAFGGGAAPFAFGGPAAAMGPNLSAFEPQPPAPVAPPVAAPAPEPVPLPRPRPPMPAPAPAPVAAAAPSPDAEGPRGDNLPRTSGYTQGFEPAPLSFGGRLEKGLMGFLGNIDKGPIGALLGGGAALVTGRSTDPSSILQEQRNATAQALINKGVPAADVQAAIQSPEVMKAVLGQYYGKDKYSIAQTGETQDGSKQYSVFNSNDGTYKPISVAGDPNEPGGTIMFNGKQITIPPGVNRKEFIKKITDAEANRVTGNMTETQANASSFAARMETAERNLKGLENEGTSYWGAATNNIPIVGNAMQSENYQKYRQAQSAFITALLRRESGAAVNANEFSRYDKEFFPQPGDTPDVIAQKAQMRRVAIDQMKSSAGPGYKAPANGVTQSGLRWSVN